MDETVITWNWPNWLTVGLMSMFFLGVVAFGIQAWSNTNA